MTAPGQFYDPSDDGPMGLQLTRVDTKRFRLCRRIGYIDHEYPDKPFVIPARMDWTSDLASTPGIFTWVVPVLGRHFPAIVLHDALVVADRNSAPDHIGPPISREEADRIMRDAMGELGTGSIRRWVAWAGAMVATTYSAWGLDAHKRLYQALLTFNLLAIAVLGVLATLDVFDVVDAVPWIFEGSFAVELLWGLAGAIVIPLLMSIPWWSRWRFPAIVGVGIAPLLPIVAGIIVLVVGYFAAEYLLGNVVGLTRDPPPPTPDDRVCRPPEPATPAPPPAPAR